MIAGRKVIFLDRDGTINVDHGYVHRISDWEFTNRATESLRVLQAHSYSLVVVTNQAGIADGRYSEADLESLHAHMENLLRISGVTLESVVYCPHHRNANCECRKPKTGMARMAEAVIGAIDYPQSWMVGDKESDILFGKNIGARTALIKSAYWQPESLATHPDLIVGSLFEYATAITHSS